MSRWLALALVVLFSLEADAAPTSPPVAPPFQFRSGAVASTSSTLVRGCAAWPAAFDFLFDADAVDGDPAQANRSYANGGLIATWKNQGFVVGDAGSSDSGSGATWRPTMEKASPSLSDDAVSFDGVADNRTVSGGSAHTAAFFSATGIFDLFIVLRHDSAAYSSFVGSTSTSAEIGILFDMAGASNQFDWYILRGVGGTNNLGYTTTYTVPIGTWAYLEARGNGTTFKTAKNGGAYETQAFSNLPFTSGDATRSLTVGAAVGAGPSYPFDGAIAFLGISSTELTTADRAAVQSIFACRYGL